MFIIRLFFTKIHYSVKRSLDTVFKHTILSFNVFHKSNGTYSYDRVSKTTVRFFPMHCVSNERNACIFNDLQRRFEFCKLILNVLS